MILLILYLIFSSAFILAVDYEQSDKITFLSVLFSILTGWLLMPMRLGVMSVLYFENCNK